MSLSLCWFRTDLRVRDNLALQSAVAKGPSIGLYIATPKQWQKHDDAPIKLDFWRRNLIELEASLAKLGIPLVICQVADYAAVPAVIKDVVEKLSITSLSFNAEYPLYEARRDDEVSMLCQALGVEAEVCHDQVLLQPGSILNNSGEPFKVFTPFSKKCRASLYIPGSAATVAALKSPAPSLATIAKHSISGQCSLKAVDWPQADPVVWADRWPAGEAHAHKLLNGFCGAGIRDYRKNRDFPAVTGTSSLSPWINAGVISIRDCWRQATASHQGEGPETWKNELLWREFYRHIFFHYPHVSKKQPFKNNVAHVLWRHDEAEFKLWCEGRTGFPIIDAAMRQLLETGWMHNRLRMITAMFLSKHLLIDWRWGEQWFMQHLIDGDFSANNGGWQWSASTGTDAVPYFRIFNPVTQSRRFDEAGGFIRHFVPELEELDDKSIHEPGLLKPEQYPVPMIDLKFGRERALAAFKP